MPLKLFVLHECAIFAGSFIFQNKKERLENRSGLFALTIYKNCLQSLIHQKECQ